MLKSLFSFLSVFMFSFLAAEECPKDIESLKQYLDERIWAYEASKKMLTDGSDIYTYYMIYGKQAAYQEIMIILEDMIQEERCRLAH